MRATRFICIVGGAALPLALWIAVSMVGSSSLRSSALPAPAEVVDALRVNSTYFIGLTITTAAASAAGLLLAVVIATILSVGSLSSGSFEALITPSAVLVKATPAIAFAPLLAVVIHDQMIARAVLGAAICFFPLFIGALDRGRSTPARMVTLAKVYGAKPAREFFRIRFVYLLDGLASSLKTAAPMAVIGAIVGEWMGGAPAGLGSLFRPISNQGELVDSFCAVVLAALVGLSLYSLSWIGWWLLDRRLHLRF